MKKKAIILVILVLFISAIGFIVATNITVGPFSNEGRKDTYSRDITYIDEAREIPIVISIDFDIEHGSDEDYTFMIFNKDSKISYDAKIQSGEVSILIKDGNTIIEKFVIGESGEGILDAEFDPNYAYTMQIMIDAGKGSLELNWEG